MQNFFSTLAQITATLLGIFLASLTAYFVFLEERSTQFEDHIEQVKLEIRDSLLRLRTTWPWTLALYLPPEFSDSYRSKYISKSRADLITQAAADLLFQNAEMRGTITGIHEKDSFGGPWEGRVYFWILTEVVTEITVGTPDTRTKPEGVFPSSADGPGFDEWRADLEKLRGSLQILYSYRERWITNFDQFIANLPPIGPKEQIKEIYGDAVTSLFKEVEFVKAKLNEIDKQEFSKKRYSFSDRVDRHSIFVLVVLAVLIGLILPLIFLALPAIKMTSTLAIVFLLATLIFIVGTFAQFGQDISRPMKFDVNVYVSARWYFPMLKEMERQKSAFDDGGLLDIEYFSDAHNSGDRKHFSKEVLEALDNYISQGKTYNDKTVQFNNMIVKKIRSHETLSGLIVKPPSNNASQMLLPYTLLDDIKFREVSEKLNPSPNNDISFEVIMPRWRHVELIIPGRAIEAHQLAKSLGSIHSAIKNEDIAKRFLEERIEVQAAERRLREVIISANRRH